MFIIARGLRRKLQKAQSVLTGINTAAGRFVAWFMPLMTAGVLAIIMFASVFRLGWVWPGELVAYMHAILFMTAAAYTLAFDEHVRIDVWFGRMSVRGRAIVNLSGVLFLLVPVCIVILFYSFPYVRDSWATWEHSSEGAGLPAVFVLKSFILVLPILLLMQGAAILIDACLVLFGDIEGEGKREKEGDKEAEKEKYKEGEDKKAR